MWLAFGIVSASLTDRVLLYDLDSDRVSDSAIQSLGELKEPRTDGLRLLELRHATPFKEVRSKLRGAGVEFVLHPNSEFLDRRVALSIERHLEYRKAIAAARLGRMPKRKDRPYPGFLDAYLDWLRSRGSIDDKLDPAAINAAADHRDSLPIARVVEPIPTELQTASTINLWNYVGPKNYQPNGENGFGSQLLGGRKNGIAVSYQDPNKVFVASAEGGIWRTLDAGVTWEPLSDDWRYLGMNCVAVSPEDDDIVLAGGGDYDWDRSTFLGLHRSTDGGNTWSIIGTGWFGGMQVRKIMFDPQDSNIVIALVTKAMGPSNTGAIYKSTDAGATWVKTSAPEIRWDDIDFLPNGTYIAVAGGYYVDQNGDESGDLRDGRIMYSSSEGNTWFDLTPPNTGAGHLILDVACSKTDSLTVYLIAPGVDRVYKTTDLGLSWTDISTGFPHVIGTNRDHWSQDDYDLYFEAVADAGQDVLFVGLLSLVASPDGGSTWYDLGRSYESDSRIHADQQCFAVIPGQARFFYAGNDGGIYRMFWIPALAAIQDPAFTSLNAGLNDFLTVALELHPTNGNRMMAGHQDNGTPAALGDLENWTSLGGGDGGNAAYDRSNPRLHYSTGQRLQSVNQFTTINDLTPLDVTNPAFDSFDTDFVSPIVMAGPSFSNLFAGALRDLWLYGGQGGAGPIWIPSGNDFGVIGELYAAPSDGNVIYIGGQGESATNPQTGPIWRRDPSGTFSLVGTLDSPIGALAVHPTDPNRVLAGTFSHGLFECTNAMVAAPVFTDRNGDGSAGTLPSTPITALAYDPNAATTWYAGTDLGLFKSTDEGLTWARMTGLPAAPVSDLRVGPDGNLYAATRGRGIWKLTVLKVEVAGVLIPENVYWDDDVPLKVKTNYVVDRYIPIELRDDSNQVSTPPIVPFSPGDFERELTLPLPSGDRRQTVRFAARFDGKTVTARTNIYPKPPIGSFSVSASTASSGGSVEFTARFAQRLPADARIEIFDDSEMFSTPGSLTIPRGSREGKFTGSVGTVGVPQIVRVAVRFGGSVRQLQLQLIP